MNPRYHLTDHGRALWRIQRLSGYEYDEQGFIERFLLSAPKSVGKCWGCYEEHRLIVGMFCAGCVQRSIVQV